jgi:hypothetical protein
MTKCKRCNSVQISITGETCLCGEPLRSLYYPKTGEFNDDGRTRRAAARRKGVDEHNIRYNDLLSDIRKFCSRYSVPYTVFGRRFLNDPNLVYRLMNGANPRPDTVKRIKEAMFEYEHNVARA